MEDNQTTPGTNTTFADVKLPDANNAPAVTVGGTAPAQPTFSDTVAPSTSVPIQVDEPKPDMNSSRTNLPTNPTTPPSAPHKGGGGHVVAIIIAVIIFIALAGAVVYVYMKSNSTKITRKESTPTTSNSVAPATAQDVDETTKSIDADMQSLEADKDFTSNDLSDATLGL